MASRSIGVGNDPAIANVRAPDYRQYESRSFNETLGGRPNRVGYAGARGFKSAGFGGYETGPDGNLRPSMPGDGTEASRPSSSQYGNPMLDAPRPNVGRNAIASVGAKAAGEVAKRGMSGFNGDIPKPGGGFINPMSGTQGWAESGVGAGGQQTATAANVRGIQGEALDPVAGTAPGADMAWGANARAFPYNPDGTNAAGPVEGVPLDANGIPKFDGSALEGAEYSRVGQREFQIGDDTPKDWTQRPDADGNTQWYRPDGDGGELAVQNYDPQQFQVMDAEYQFADQWGNNYWTDSGGSVANAYGPSFEGVSFGGADVLTADDAALGAAMSEFGGGGLELASDAAGSMFGSFGTPGPVSIASAAFDIGGDIMRGDGLQIFGDAVGGSVFGNILGAVGGGCFITEAVMAAGGKDDNAEELQVLRWFRDNVMMTNPQGQAMASEYEAIAPTIVEAIGSRPDGMQVFQQLYSQFILPAVESIRANNMKGALEIYSQMIAFVTPFATEMMGDASMIEGAEQLGDDAAMVAHDDMGTASIAGPGGGVGNADWQPPEGQDPTAMTMQPTAAPMRAGAPVMTGPGGVPAAGRPPGSMPPMPQQRPGIAGVSAGPRRF